jgi:glycosyltransferase involved in cell wall biosynthesis
MKIIFDYRVLTHKTYTGVENYTKNILENLKNKCKINITKPIITNKYLSHLWTHFILPFKSGNILFCPANISPIFIPKSKKLVVTIHDVAFLRYPESFSIFFRIYYKLIIPIVIKRAEIILTVSNYSKNEIEKYYPISKGKIKVIYLGYDKDFKVFDKIKKKNQILFVGSINKRKNFIGVIKAFELLNIKDYNLLIVGNFSTNFFLDENDKIVIEKAKKNPNIVFKSNINNRELIQIYNESKLFLLPSFYEGFGLPVLESMACGTPVICSDSSSLPEVGLNAVIYCDAYDINNIKEKIELVLSDENLQKEMIKKGLELVKLFNWEKSAQEHIKIFEEVLKN